MNTPLEDQQCGNCRYRRLRRFNYTTSNFNVLTQSFETEEIATSVCRRDAPQLGANERVAAWWPIVSDDDWCGEWVLR